MIEIQNIDKYYPTALTTRKYIYKNFSLDIPTEKNLAIIGRNGVGKSTLIRLLGGIEEPNEGCITSDKSISWPLGLSTGILPSMTGQENTDFICKIYGVENTKEAHEFVLDFSELGKNYFDTVKRYSSGMRSRLAFALSLLFKFDVMLLDELMAVGDAQFKRKCSEVFDVWRSNNTSLILVSHSFKAIREQCDAGLILTGGEPLYFEDVNDALKEYSRMTRDKQK